jgi:hypothetical protein
MPLRAVFLITGVGGSLALLGGVVPLVLGDGSGGLLTLLGVGALLLGSFWGASLSRRYAEPR